MHLSLTTMILDVYDLLGRIVVLRQGGRNIGCGRLRPACKRPYEEAMVAFMGPYPGYDGPLRPKGTVEMTYANNNNNKNNDRSTTLLAVSLRADGLEHLCRNCALRVRTGTACDDAHRVGEPHVTSTDVDDAASSLSSSIYIDNGHDLRGNAGRVVFLHGSDGMSVSCGVLRDEDRRVDGDSLFGNVVRYGCRAEDKKENARP